MEIKLASALRAGYTFFYTQTFEMDRAVEKVTDEIKSITQVEWKIKIWDFETDNGDVDQVTAMLRDEKPYTVIVAKNYNWFLSSDSNGLNYEAVQLIQNRFQEFCSRASRKALVILGDQDFSSAIPSVLQKEFISIDFPLPNKEEAAQILNDIIEAASSNESFVPPAEEEKENIIEAALGLTKRGIQNAYAYSIIESGKTIDAKIVSSIRSAEINETAGLTVGQYDVEDIKGYSTAKDYIRMAINNPDSRGVLLLGPPGVGKTHLAKWTSTISSKILIEFELAQVQGQGLYGQAEAAMAASLKVVESIQNCVLFIDEIEKAVPGKGSTNDTTGTRSFGQLLKFLSDKRPKGCFVIATCNDITKLPPEWVRSGRFDVIFFADLPSDEEKAAIYESYLSKFGVETGGFTVGDMKNWTGAEIESACRIASVIGKGVKDAASYVVPVASTMKSDIENLRAWAKGRTVPANAPTTNKVARRALEI